MKEIKSKMKMYDAGGGYLLMIYDSEDDDEELWNVILIKNGYGIAEYLVGFPKKQATIEECVEMVTNTIEKDKEMYREHILDMCDAFYRRKSHRR